MAETLTKGLHYKLRDFRLRFHSKPRQKDTITISEAEETFLARAVKQNPDKLTRFRMTMKVHKTPWKMRPIVCCSGTFMND